MGISMAQPTYLQLVNELLLRLRESTVDTVSKTDYSQLLGLYINQAKDEVEDAWNWNVLRETLRVKTEPGVWNYIFTDAGYNSRVLNVYNDTLDQELCPQPRDVMTRLLTQNTQQNRQPISYDINSFYDDAIEINLYPKPDAEYWINIDVVIPSEDLSADTDELYVPKQPVILNALILALEERGEIGQAALEREDQKYRTSLLQAITNDHDRHPFEKVWEVD